MKSMPDGAITLLMLQMVYIFILTLIIWRKRKQKRNAVFYWLIAMLYIFVAICLVHEYLTMQVVGEGGTWFAIEMYGTYVTGLLVSIALVVFFAEYILRDFKTKQ